MDEFELIRRYFKRASRDADVLVGVGDDGAVMVPAPGRELVSVVDTLVEGVHFPGNLDPSHIGYRAVAVNLSDIAAMGGRPRWMTLALTLDSAEEDWLAAFSAGLFEAADAFDVSLVGGDTTHGAGKVITVQLLGDIRPGQLLQRTGARAGDLLCASGTFGDAAAGLRLLDAGRELTPQEEFLALRFCRPSARIVLGQALCGIATATIDVSDGLLGDAGKMLAASGVGATINIDDVPISDELRRLHGDAAIELAMTGGDDYELCFTLPVDRRSDLVQLSLETGVRLTCIGVVDRAAGIRCRRGGDVLEFDDTGYSHFQQGL